MIGPAQEPDFAAPLTQAPCPQPFRDDLRRMPGRDFATPDDVKDVARMVLAHRVIVQPEAEIEGASGATVLDEVLATVPVPRA